MVTLYVQVSAVSLRDNEAMGVALNFHLIYVRNSARHGILRVEDVCAWLEDISESLRVHFRACQNQAYWIEPGVHFRPSKNTRVGE